MTPAHWNIRRNLILVGLAAAGLPTGLFAQARQFDHQIHKVVHKCPAKGRFLPIPTESRTKQYCFDGNYYDSKTVPSYVVEYFAQKRAESEAREKSISDATNASLRRTQQRAADMASRPANSGGRPYTSQRSGGSVSSRGTEAALLLPANNKPAPVAVPMAKLRQIAVGDSGVSVKEALQDPHGRIAGLGSDDEEIWTYVAEGGAFAKVYLKAGVVKSISLP